eukprot:TRINITY_DN32323_c0_g1_i1.p1 TRINITY_DN32323_c0_g1~~TRINITY_DN32323_c0_g1_i1.p1  ORF type:complete len:628 (+),score=313.17 TRINITY_DN32323_c0_g1_i1:59-1942(+)
MVMSKRLATAAQKRCLSYKPPNKEIKFLFNDTLKFQEHFKELPGHVSEECTEEFVDDIMSAAGQLATETLLPLYQPGDAGCKWVNGDVITPEGFKDAWEQYKAGGWNALNYPTEYGGMNLPLSLSLIKNEMCATANWSWFMYPGLTLGCTNTIVNHGSQWMKDTFLPKLVDLTWSGVMCLTEPHCGTDLGEMKTKAVPGENGTYKITGTKIFISAGEQDMTENIVHIVLAKLPDAPKGTKGISLFLVPKYRVAEDGSIIDSKKKNVECGSIEEKMGIHGCSTCQMHFEDSEGWLIGDAHDGLRQMFTFMNTARIGTGIQGLAHMELAYQNAVHYALERGSMRALSGAKEKEKTQDSIIWHAAVRQDLMVSKALTEGCRALLYDVAKFGDKIQYAEAAGDHELAKKLDDEMGFLTPVAKGCVTEWAYEVSNKCLAIYGGHGFIKGHGMEQIVRDCRIATLYEGTTHIQALDMLGRKMFMDKLKLFNKWNAKLRGYAWGVMGNSAFRAEGLKLYQLTALWKVDVMKMGYRAMKNKDTVSASSVDNMWVAGYILLGYYHLKMGIAAQEKLAKEGSSLSEADRKFLKSKVATTKFYFSHVIGRIDSHRAAMVKAPDNIYSIANDEFLHPDE